MKIATYGTMHLGIAFGVAWVLTGDLAVAGAIAMVEPAVQTVAYALHERVWQRHGRSPRPDAARTGARALVERVRRVGAGLVAGQRGAAA